jgi:argininosuccinate synthase
MDQENYGGAEIIAYCGDVGQGDDPRQCAARLATGGAECVVETCARSSSGLRLQGAGGRAVYEDNSPGTALARPLLAYRQVQVGSPGADALAHGATGKGNETRFVSRSRTGFAPHLRVIAPWREWMIRSREEALARGAHGRPSSTRRATSSAATATSGTSHEGGNLEDPWDPPRRDMFQLTVDPADAPDAPEGIVLGFEKGVPVTLDGERLGPVALVEALNRIAGAHGVGRVDLIENRLVGIKSRGVYETPAGTVLHLAHRELERLVLDRDTLHFKQSVSVRYAQLIYDGLWFSTLREALACFVDFTERDVTGEVKLRLFKGRAEAVGRRSPRSLYRQDLATFGAGMAYDHADAGGFIRLYGLPERVRALTREPIDAAFEVPQSILSKR